MFPLHCLIQAVDPNGADCPSCVQGSDQLELLADTFAVIANETPLSSLTETVLVALGMVDYAHAAVGKIQIRNWKTLALCQVADNLETSAEVILKDVSNAVTLVIFVKKPDIGKLSEEEVRINAIRSQILQLSKNSAICDWITEKNGLRDCAKLVCHGDVSRVTPEMLENLHMWLSQQRQNHNAHSVPRKRLSLASMSTSKFNQLTEIPKLQRWFQESSTPTRPQMTQYMHMLNSTNIRRFRPKITYQQICNWFSNARANQRRLRIPSALKLTNGIEEANGIGGGTDSQDGDKPGSQISPKVNNTKVRNASISFNTLLLPETPLNCTPTSESFSPILNHAINSSSDHKKITDLIGSEPDSSRIKTEVSESLAPVPAVSAASTEAAGNPINWSMEMDLSGPASNGPLRPFSSSSPSGPMNLSQSATVSGSQSSLTLSVANIANSPAANQQHRSRLMFDPMTEIPLLERWFDENPHPAWSQIDEYTRTLNSYAYREMYPHVTTYNVKIWFKNRRAKNKRLGLGVMQNGTATSPDGATAGFD